MFRVLDLFCGAGGAAMGLHRAWPDAVIVGVDIHPQPRYPFTFVQGDALKPPFDLAQFDFIWASPVCKSYSKSKGLAHKHHPKQIENMRRILQASGKPYVIENVPGAPLHNPVALNGFMFGLNLDRTRLFESNVPLSFALLPTGKKPVKMGRPVKAGEVIQVVGHFSNVPYARQQMGIDWMGQKELSQAIPPAYSEYIARQIRK